MAGPIDHGSYPIRDYRGPHGAITERGATSEPMWPAPRRATSDAPNVIVILLDDLGYSDLSPYGSEIDTPALAELADTGYRLTNYQTPPMCAPARAALLTGMNPHRVGFAFVPHQDPGYPHSRMEIPADVPTLAEHFRGSGYATFMVGKWHLTAEARMNDGADRSSWPVQRGFDRYFGCMDGFTSLFAPHRLMQDNSALVIDEFPDDYYLTDEMTEAAIGMIDGLRANDPEKPFLLYYAHQAVHGPVQAKAVDIEKYRDRYRQGWDAVRAARFERQVAAGLFPEGTQPAPRNTEPGMDVPPWDSLTEEEQERYARFMEVYAAAVDNVDQNLRRLTDHLKAIGEYENTIIVFTSDNGATAEGGDTGTRSYFSQFGARGAMPEGWQRDVPRDLDLIGGPQTMIHYPRGWAYASNTPFRLYKQNVHAGGVRVPFFISWPQGLPRQAGDDGIRHQYAHAIDIADTLMTLAGVAPLDQRAGASAPERDGVSFDAWLTDAAAPTSHTEQLIELAAKRAYLDGDWKLISNQNPGPNWDDDAWSLFNLATDPTELHDVAAEHPERVRAMAEQWRAAAWNNQVFPIDTAGRFRLERPSSELILEAPVTLLPGAATLERFRSSKLTKLRSFTIEIDLDYRVGDAGVLVAHGDQGGGYSLWIEQSRLHLSYNLYGEMIRESAPIAAGTRRIVATVDAVPDLSWQWRITIDGEPVIELGPVFQLTGFAPFTGISVGLDRGGPVDWSLSRRHGSFAYHGELYSVRYVPGPKAAYNPEVIREVESTGLLSHE